MVASLADYSKKCLFKMGDRNAISHGAWFFDNWL